MRLVLLFFCLFTLSLALYDPNLNFYNEDDIELSNNFPTPRGDENVCGTGQLNFFWGIDKDSRSIATPRFAEIYFFINNTFADNTFGYLGTWAQFGENGDDSLLFQYPTATYLAPVITTYSGSMISNHVCGSWYFTCTKWFCTNTCVSQL